MGAEYTPKGLVNGLPHASTLVHLKTAMGGDTHRGFESHALRFDQPKPALSSNDGQAAFPASDPWVSSGVRQSTAIHGHMTGRSILGHDMVHGGRWHRGSRPATTTDAPQCQFLT